MLRPNEADERHWHRENCRRKLKMHLRDVLEGTAEDPERRLRMCLGLVDDLELLDEDTEVVSYE